MAQGSGPAGLVSEGVFEKQREGFLLVFLAGWRNPHGEG